MNDSWVHLHVTENSNKSLLQDDVYSSCVNLEAGSPGLMGLISWSLRSQDSSLSFAIGFWHQEVAAELYTQ